MDRSLIAATSFILTVLGITFLVMGSIEIKQSNEIQKTLCTVNDTVMWSCENNNDMFDPCAILILNATICGNIDARTTFTIRSITKEEVQKKYPLGSSVDCWVDTNNCSIYSEDNKPRLVFGIVSLLLSLLLIGFMAFFVYKLRHVISTNEEEERILN